MEEKVIINDADLPESVSEEIKSGDEATIPNADNPVNDKIFWRLSLIRK